MKKSQSALWSANVDLKKNSQLKKFCDQLKSKGFIRNKSNFKSLFGNGQLKQRKFWSEVWDFTKIKGNKKAQFKKKIKFFIKIFFFPKSQLNYAENLLKKRNNEIAINFLSESSLKKEISWRELYVKVCKFSII